MHVSDIAVAQTLASNQRFKRLSPTVIEAIASIAKAIEVAPGDLIIREGDENADLFVLIAGSAAAVRETTDGKTVVLNAIPEGDCIGELTFLDGGRRTTSVRAETPCRLITIPADTIAALPDAPVVAGELKGALASVAVHRARELSDAMLASLRRELEIKNLQNQFGHFLLLTISIFLISTILFYLVAEDFVKDVYDPGFSWQTILLFAVPCLITIRVMRIPLSDLGIKRDGLWRSLRDSLLICVAVTIPAVIYIFAFSGEQAAAGIGANVDAVFLLQYLAHTVFQEIGSRGLLQGLFQKFLNDTRGHRAVFMTSVVFASLHITFGIDALVITFFASILFGYVYLRQKNLAGVIVLHYWLGVLAAVMVAI